MDRFRNALSIIFTVFDEVMYTTLNRTRQEVGEFRIQYEAFGNVRRSAHVVNSGVGAAAPNNSVSSGAGLASDSGNENLTAEYRALMSEWSNKLHVLEAFNGQYFFNVPDDNSLASNTSHSLDDRLGNEQGVAA